MALKELSLNEIKIDDKASFVVEISNRDIERFTELSGDNNPLHCDSQYAKASGFTNNVAHGLLVSSFFSRMIGMELPGKNALILKLQFRFLKPVVVPATVNFTAVVRNVNLSTQTIELQLSATTENEVKVKGEALVKVRDFEG
ncbi:MAG: hypothetical protein A4S09_00265 [Proteobacteria bacterium SG_bin7]|nr:MAG: hypothetical protein A4S09_00265 [Proteobacteria bacterium SG_bin7]